MPQSLACAVMHLVFSTRNRVPAIDGVIEPELHAYMATILKTNDSPAIKIGGTFDHLHILFNLSRTRSIANIVEEVKKDSSKWIKTKGRKYSDFFWQAGYGIFSVSQPSVNAVKNYIADQKEHHRKLTFQDEYRKMLNQCEIEFDERYVWD